MFADSPNELIGRDVFYVIKIHSARGISNRYTDICCKYRFFLDKEDTVTKVVSDTANPKFAHVRKIAFQPATQEVIHYLTDSFVMVNVWGKQKPRKSAMLFSRGKSTRELLRNDHDIMVRPNIVGIFNINGRIVDPQKQSIIVELLLLKKQQARLQQKVDCVRRLVEKANKFGRKTVPTVIIREVLNATNSQNAEKAMSQLEVYNEDDDEEDDDECCNTQKSNASSSFCTVL